MCYDCLELPRRLVLQITGGWTLDSMQFPVYSLVTGLYSLMQLPVYSLVTGLYSLIQFPMYSMVTGLYSLIQFPMYSMVTGLCSFIQFPMYSMVTGLCSLFCALLTSKSKDWLVRNQNNVSKWGDMSIRGLLFK